MNVFSGGGGEKKKDKERRISAYLIALGYE